MKPATERNVAHNFNLLIQLQRPIRDEQHVCGEFENSQDGVRHTFDCTDGRSRRGGAFSASRHPTKQPQAMVYRSLLIRRKH